MVEILALWAFTLVACVSLGEAVCRLAGLRSWSWLSGAIGLCVLLVIGAAGASLPGRATTAFVVIALLSAAAAGWIAWSERRELAPLVLRVLDPLLLAGGVLGATLIPFVANGRVGLLGPSFNNDSRFHLWAAEYLASNETVPSFVLGGGYPLGPHGLVAALANGLGTGVEAGFVALLMIVPVLTAFAARALLRDVPRLFAIAIAGLTATTYLLASYYAQAAFKETLQALFVLALAVTLRELVAQRRIGPRAAPLPALLAVGSLLTYSYPGLAWLAGTMLLAAVALLVVNRRSLRRDVARAALRRALPTLGVLALVVLVAVAPQAGRLFDFFDQLSLSPSGTGVIDEGNIGNLVAPLSGFEMLGIWFREDFRFEPADGLLTVVLGSFAALVAIYGAAWWLRRRELVVVAAVVVSGALYLVLRQGESAYLAAKALVILSPFPVLLGARALLARSERPAPARTAALRYAIAAVFVGCVAWSSLLALRNGQVEADVHERELISLRALLKDKDVLFLGDDDYIGWRLFGVQVLNLSEERPFGLRKRFVEGESLDFDAFPPDRLDRYGYVVTTRTGYASIPPSNFKLVRRTRSYDVYERTELTPPAALLEEGVAPGAVLDCAGDPRQRRLSRRSGRALVRPAPVVVQTPFGIGAGSAVAAPITLPSAGRWEISLQYSSPQVLTVSTDTGVGWRLPPNLDRFGPYWRVGDVQTRAATTLRLELRLDRAAPPDPDRRQPVRAAGQDRGRADRSAAALGGAAQRLRALRRSLRTLTRPARQQLRPAGSTRMLCRCTPTRRPPGRRWSARVLIVTSRRGPGARQSATLAMPS